MLGLSPVRFAVTATALVPDPNDCVVVELKVVNVLLVPHSNHPDVADPFGLILPFSVDELDVTDVAAVVVTVASTADVVKLKIPSFCVPAPF